MLPGLTVMSSPLPNVPSPLRVSVIPVAIDCGSTFEPGLNLSVICCGATYSTVPSAMKSPTFGKADTKSNAITCRASSCSRCWWASARRQRRAGLRPPARRRRWEKRFRTEVNQQDRNMDSSLRTVREEVVRAWNREPWTVNVFETKSREERKDWNGRGRAESQSSAPNTPPTADPPPNAPLKQKGNPITGDRRLSPRRNRRGFPLKTLSNPHRHPTGSASLPTAKRRLGQGSVPLRVGQRFGEGSFVRSFGAFWSTPPCHPSGGLTIGPPGPTGARSSRERNLGEWGEAD